MFSWLLTLAHATVGEPESVEVLGWLPAEHKVFLLRESGLENPQVWYYRLDDPPPPEQRPDRPVRVVSWAQDTLADRIVHLRTRLEPLTPAPLTGMEVVQVLGDEVECGTPLSPRTCRAVDVTIRWGGQQARTSLLTEGRLAVVGAWTVPGTDRRLVMLQHIGVHIECGYTTDVPLLLTGP
jgi:hypothetical protein